MHIPDGYLSPQTCLVMGTAMLPIWYKASRKVKEALNTRYVPLMVIGAAFSFVIMMFNIPVPDGTTAHAVGGAILSIILGPWAACICITIALTIQALFFGDGGIWALAANCFNMAFILPMSSFYAYRFIAGNSAISSKRRFIGSLMGGFIGINLAALFTAIEFGVQPLLFHAADGTPLYSPYPLGMAIAMMAFAHLIVAGPLEGVVTAFAVRFLHANNPSLLEITGHANSPVNYRKLWWGVAAMILLSPLGLLANGVAWGEWGLDEMASRIGYIPEGMARFAESWHAFAPDYGFAGMAGGFWQSSVGYVLAAVVGVVLIAVITYMFGKLAMSNKRELESGGLDIK